MGIEAIDQLKRHVVGAVVFETLDRLLICTYSEAKCVRRAED